MNDSELWVTQLPAAELAIANGPLKRTDLSDTALRREIRDILKITESRESQNTEFNNALQELSIA